VHEASLAVKRSFARGPDEVRFELDRRETGGAFRQRGEAPHSRAGVRDRNDGCRVEELVWGEMLGPELEPRLGRSRSDAEELDPELTRKPALHRLLKPIAER
jgi:hypothetical protein